MSPQETSWVSGLVGGGITLLFVLLGNLIKRFDPDVKAKTEEALWAKVQEQLEESGKREARLEERVTLLESQRESDRKRITELEAQIKAKDLQIVELTRQVQGKKKGLM